MNLLLKQQWLKINLSYNKVLIFKAAQKSLYFGILIYIQTTKADLYWFYNN